MIDRDVAGEARDLEMAIDAEAFAERVRLRAKLADMTADRDRLAKLYEASVTVLALHLNNNCTKK